MARATSTRCSASRRRPATTRSRRPTASWPASGTRTATTTTPTPRSASRRSSRPTTRSRRPEKRKEYDSGGISAASAAAAVPDRSAARGRRLRGRRSRRHLLDDLQPRGAAAARPRPARPRPRDRGPAQLRPGDERHPDHVAVPTAERCPTCGGTAPSRAPPPRLPALRRPRRRLREPGLLLDQPAVPGVRRPARSSRTRARPAAARASPSRPSATRSTSRRASTTAAGSGSPARARPARGGGPPGDLYVTTRVTPSPVFPAARRQPRRRPAGQRHRGDPGRRRSRCRR